MTFRIIKAFFAGFLSLPLISIGQIDIKKGIYDEIYSTKVIKTQSDFNLKGSVKKVVEISLEKPDTSILLFNRGGYLVRKASTNLTSSPYITSASFLFNENGKLAVVVKEFNYIESISKDSSFFNDAGYLIRKVSSSKSTKEENLYRIASYSYDSSHTTITVKYEYFPEPGWVIIEETYKLSFDLKKRVIQVRSDFLTSSENRNGSLSTYSYDSLTGNLVSVHLRTDGAGEVNSMLGMLLSVQYDTSYNSISETLQDYTIRNALWSYSYFHFARYDENNNIIEETNPERSHYFDPSNLLDPKLKPQPRKYVYKYDYKGNWVEQYLIVGTEKKLIKTKSFDYY